MHRARQRGRAAPRSLPASSQCRRARVLRPLPDARLTPGSRPAPLRAQPARLCAAMPKQAADIKDDESALLAVCGSDSMMDRVKSLWEEMMEKKRLDCSNQGLTDDATGRLLKGLHMCARLSLHQMLRVDPPTSRRSLRDDDGSRPHSRTGWRRTRASRPSAPSPSPSPSSTSRVTTSPAKASGRHRVATQDEIMCNRTAQMILATS